MTGSASAIVVDYNFMASLIACLALIVSVGSAVFTWQAKRLSEKETAKSVYRRYLELAFENPKFVGDDTDKDYVGEERIRYRLFVSMLLHACEEILERDNDKEWRVTITRQLERHTAYLGAMDERQCSQYDESVRSVVRKLVGGNW